MNIHLRSFIISFLFSGVYAKRGAIHISSSTHLRGAQKLPNEATGPSQNPLSNNEALASDVTPPSNASIAKHPSLSNGDSEVGQGGSTLLSRPRVLQSLEVSFHQCVLAMNSADTTNDSLLNQNEYVAFVNGISNDLYAGESLGTVPVGVRQNFFQLRDDSSGQIDISGSKPGDTQTEVQLGNLQNVCSSTVNAVNAAAPTTSPATSAPETSAPEMSHGASPAEGVPITIPETSSISEDEETSSMVGANETAPGDDAEETSFFQDLKTELGIGGIIVLVIFIALCVFVPRFRRAMWCLFCCFCEMALECADDDDMVDTPQGRMSRSEAHRRGYY